MQKLKRRKKLIKSNTSVIIICMSNVVGLSLSRGRQRDKRDTKCLHEGITVSAFRLRRCMVIYGVASSQT